jgi:hypothetical protein
MEVYSTTKPHKYTDTSKMNLETTTAYKTTMQNTVARDSNNCNPDGNLGIGDIPHKEPS